VIKLKVIQGEEKGKTFRCNGKVVEIGRAPSNTVVLRDPMVSWRHGVVELKRGRYVYRDLASKNGTTLYQDRKRTVMKGCVQGRTIGKNNELLLGATVLKVADLSRTAEKEGAKGKAAAS
jgi:pSer/pThr/pTyr-binding forkhead associated (FHA) protein